MKDSRRRKFRRKITPLLVKRYRTMDSIEVFKRIWYEGIEEISRAIDKEGNRVKREIREGK